ncbi:GTPase ObgE [Candidatus Saccharibacteria bacterium]|nr:GTPase ObgE [Candidatus Saccharibacteria bacterium]
MFVDTAKVSLKAGKGGDGAVSFRHEIYIPKGGPDGGDGGKGGDIIFRADRNTNTLVDFRFTPILTAEDGKNGSGQRSAGRSGKDLVVDVPIGTVVYKVSELGPFETIRDNGSELASEPRNDGRERSGSRKDLIADLTHDGDEIVVAHGGSGGFGNAHFKSRTRQAPIIAEVGEPGEEFEAELELKSMADVGLVGLPNAGKSTFLSVVSNAKPEIADYPFTTITPNLGVATVDDHDLLIADIPGLIEGASDGKGLGHDFLRHVDRTTVLLHLIDVYNDDAGEAYQTIRNELEKYSDLAARPEVVALTKCEGVDEDIIKMQMSSILAKNPAAKIFAISSSAHQGLTELLRELKRVYSEGERQVRETAHKASATSSSETLSRQRERTERLSPVTTGAKERVEEERWRDADLPVISLASDALKDTWRVEKLDDDHFKVTGEKIEKFARKTDLGNYASLNRLRDIMKKMGIRAELTTQGAKPDSIIEIAGKEFTLVEDW